MNVQRWRRPEGAPPFIFGHRGASHGAPENTLTAFELAEKEGADGIELDVRLDRAGEVVVSHDPTLKRATNGRDTRKIEHVTPQELDRIDVGAGERLPRLTEVLSWLRGRQLRVNIELKSDLQHKWQLVLRSAALVQGYPRAREQVLFSSFHPAMVAALVRLVPEVPSAWLVHRGQRVLKEAPGRRVLGAPVLHPQHTLVTPRRFERWRRSGAIVNVWTVNDLARGAELAQLGVDALISDTPGAMRERVSGS